MGVRIFLAAAAATFCALSLIRRARPVRSAYPPDLAHAPSRFFPAALPFRPVSLRHWTVDADEQAGLPIVYADADADDGSYSPLAPAHAFSPRSAFAPWLPALRADADPRFCVQKCFPDRAEGVTACRAFPKARCNLLSCTAADRSASGVVCIRRQTRGCMRGCGRSRKKVCCRLGGAGAMFRRIQNACRCENCLDGEVVPDVNCSVVQPLPAAPPPPLPPPPVCDCSTMGSLPPVQTNVSCKYPKIYSPVCCLGVDGNLTFAANSAECACAWGGGTAMKCNATAAPPPPPPPPPPVCDCSVMGSLPPVQTNVSCPYPKIYSPVCCLGVDGNLTFAANSAECACAWGGGTAMKCNATALPPPPQ